eukprot:6374850-Amphidinium_carterae.1
MERLAPTLSMLWLLHWGQTASIVHQLKTLAWCEGGVFVGDEPPSIQTVASNDHGACPSIAVWHQAVDPPKHAKSTTRASHLRLLRLPMSSVVEFSAGKRSRHCKQRSPWKAAASTEQVGVSKLTKNATPLNGNASPYCHHASRNLTPPRRVAPSLISTARTLNRGHAPRRTDHDLR